MSAKIGFHGGNAEIERPRLRTFSELCPGEKLYEDLLIGDTATPTSHPHILTATEIALD